jgi:hypothetical protein
VLDSYYNAKTYGPLVSYQLGMNAIVAYESPQLHRLSESLVRDRERGHLIRLWTGVLAKRRNHYWTAWSYRNKIEGYEAEVFKAKTHVIAGYNYFLKALQNLDERDECQRVQQALAQFEAGKLKTITTKPDPRKIDVSLFWNLVSSAQAGAETVAAQIELLVAQLKEFSGPQIRSFQKILYRKMRETYHWNVWALAYLAQNGCSDDAFEEFRPWLILQGEDTVTKAIKDPSLVLEVVPEGLETSAGALLSAASIAFELRTGKPLVVEEKLESEPHGQSWEEEELLERFPEVYAHYEGIRSSNSA